MSKNKKECYVFGNFSTFNKDFAKGMSFDEFKAATKGIRVKDLFEVYKELGGKGKLPKSESK